MKTTNYKPKSQPDTIIRRDLQDGEFATISNKIMMDTNLTSDAFRFLMILLNNSNEWEIQVGFFSRKLGWDRKKTAKVIANLVEAGYLKYKKIPLGRHLGFEYIYTISELGDITPVLETPSTEETPISQPKVLETSSNDKEFIELINGTKVEIPVEFYDYWITIKYKPKFISKLAENKSAAMFLIDLNDSYNQSTYKMQLDAKNYTYDNN